MTTGRRRRDGAPADGDRPQRPPSRRSSKASLLPSTEAFWAQFPGRRPLLGRKRPRPEEAPLTPAASAAAEGRGEADDDDFEKGGPRKPPRGSHRHHRHHHHRRRSSSTSHGGRAGCSVDPFLVPPSARLSPRSDAWLGLFLTSSLSTAALSAASPAGDRATTEHAALAAMGASIVASLAVAAAYRYGPARGALTAPMGASFGEPLEGRVPANLTAELAAAFGTGFLWIMAAALAFHSGGSQDGLAANDGGGEVWNANLFWGMWTSLALAAYLVCDILTAEDASGVVPEERALVLGNAIPRGWALLSVASGGLVAFAIAVESGEGCSGGYEQSEACEDAIASVVCGIVGMALAGAYLAVCLCERRAGFEAPLHRHSTLTGRQAPAISSRPKSRKLLPSSLLAAAALLCFSVNAALVTAPTTPDHPSSGSAAPANVYVASWICFALSVYLCVRQAEACLSPGSARDVRTLVALHRSKASLRRITRSSHGSSTETAPQSQASDDDDDDEEEGAWVGADEREAADDLLSAKLWHAEIKGLSEEGPPPALSKSQRALRARARRAAEGANAALKRDAEEDDIGNPRATPRRGRRAPPATSEKEPRQPSEKEPPRRRQANPEGSYAHRTSHRQSSAGTASGDAAGRAFANHVRLLGATSAPSVKSYATLPPEPIESGDEGYKKSSSDEAGRRKKGPSDEMGRRKASKVDKGASKSKSPSTRRPGGQRDGGARERSAPLRSSQIGDICARVQAKESSGSESRPTRSGGGAPGRTGQPSRSGASSKNRKAPSSPTGGVDAPVQAKESSGSSSRSRSAGKSRGSKPNDASRSASRNRRAHRSASPARPAGGRENSGTSQSRKSEKGKGEDRKARSASPGQSSPIVVETVRESGTTTSTPALQALPPLNGGAPLSPHAPRRPQPSTMPRRPSERTGVASETEWVSMIVPPQKQISGLTHSPSLAAAIGPLDRSHRSGAGAREARGAERMPSRGVERMAPVPQAATMYSESTATESTTTQPSTVPAVRSLIGRSKGSKSGRSLGPKGRSRESAERHWTRDQRRGGVCSSMSVGDQDALWERRQRSARSGTADPSLQDPSFQATSSAMLHVREQLHEQRRRSGICSSIAAEKSQPPADMSKRSRSSKKSRASSRGKRHSSTSREAGTGSGGPAKMDRKLGAKKWGPNAQGASVKGGTKKTAPSTAPSFASRSQAKPPSVAASTVGKGPPTVSASGDSGRVLEEIEEVQRHTGKAGGALKESNTTPSTHSGGGGSGRPVEAIEHSNDETSKMSEPTMDGFPAEGAKVDEASLRSSATEKPPSAPYISPNYSDPSAASSMTHRPTQAGHRAAVDKMVMEALRQAQGVSPIGAHDDPLLATSRTTNPQAHSLQHSQWTAPSQSSGSTPEHLPQYRYETVPLPTIDDASKRSSPGARRTSARSGQSPPSGRSSARTSLHSKKSMPSSRGSAKVAPYDGGTRTPRHSFEPTKDGEPKRSFQSTPGQSQSIHSYYSEDEEGASFGAEDAYAC